ncbi:MAG TPA: PilT/PilU family type 4a pilus ATPase [Victivallales bacterium]|nr:PilT/PilU family type 4a pilus ATPase [Victivallales bacterium]HPO89948.1 PilT/PilU family type 4a pilus ATPase [Victivallales bacterium]HRU01130.1 PilT/PilU family type 4a pilus ATPase [Victivallales bacterium]
MSNFTDIIELMRAMPHKLAADLFVFPDKKAFYKIGNTIKTASDKIIDQDSIRAFAERYLRPELNKRIAERGSCDAGISLDTSMRYRVNFFIKQGALSFVARFIPISNMSFQELSLPSVLEKLAEKPRGLILLCGPAGSGKSTTVAAIVNHINENFAKHIITIEDPIEYLHNDKKSIVTQRELGADTPDFSEALRNVVRESPDVIVIGEMRDLETMKAALNAALTGHLVISTVHTANVTLCIERIVNHFPDHLREQAAEDLSLALEGIVAHRLLPSADDNEKLYPALEILLSTPLSRKTIASRSFSDLEEIMKRGYEEGMRTFARSLAELYKEGKITIEDGAAAATNKEEFFFLTQGMETGTETFRFSEDSDSEKVLNMKRLLHSAVANNASDLLITAGSPPYVRVNGEIQSLDTESLTANDTKRILFGILNQKQRESFEEKREIDFAVSVNIKRTHGEDAGKEAVFRFRINGFFQRGNVAIAVRVIPKRIPGPEELGLPKVLLELAHKRQGLFLMTGPTGHGKSTTLACLIDIINSSRACHIITIEDPIEYVHSNKRAVVEQRELHSDTLSFSNALKYVLRQDPDVILVGEMRDPETIAAALTAAETGHLVFATLHTNDCAQSIDRIIDSFPSHQQNQIRMQLAGSVLGIVSQRLLPRRDGKGRVAAFEVLVGTPAVKALIRDGKTHLINSTIEMSAKDGMITMDKSLKDLYEKNIISRKDAYAYMLSPQ